MLTNRNTNDKAGDIGTCLTCLRCEQFNQRVIFPAQTYQKKMINALACLIMTLLYWQREQLWTWAVWIPLSVLHSPNSTYSSVGNLLSFIKKDCVHHVSSFPTKNHNAYLWGKSWRIKCNQLWLETTLCRWCVFGQSTRHFFPQFERIPDLITIFWQKIIII